MPGKSSTASVSNLRETEEFINFPSKADHFNKTLERRPRVIRDLQDYSPLILITEALRKQKKIKLKSDLMPAWLIHILGICDGVCHKTFHFKTTYSSSQMTFGIFRLIFFLLHTVLQKYAQNSGIKFIIWPANISQQSKPHQWE